MSFFFIVIVRRPVSVSRSFGLGFVSVFLSFSFEESLSLPSLFLRLLIFRLSHRFFTALSVLPCSKAEMELHELPITACRRTTVRSSSTENGVDSSRPGCRWLK